MPKQAAAWVLVLDGYARTTSCNRKENPLDDAYTVPSEFIKNPEPCQRTEPSLYPLFETMLRGKGMKLQATYTCQDIADLFEVTARTIQNKVKDGTLPSRKLIGSGRFLPIDIENYLHNACERRRETVR